MGYNVIVRIQKVKLTLHLPAHKGGSCVKNRIEEIRKERGIRQDDFAKYFGMTIEEVFVFEEEDLA